MSWPTVAEALDKGACPDCTRPGRIVVHVTTACPFAGEGTSSLDHGVVPSPRLPKDAA